MAKYSFEFKMQVVREYLLGEGGCRFLERKYSIDRTIIMKWVKNFKQYGEDGLRRSRAKTVYTFEFMLSVVELYLTSELSYQQLALQVGLTNPSIICNWVNRYRAAGPEALMPKKKGRKRAMDKEKVVREIEESGSDEHKELLKQLQEENLKLRIENAFLKEARRLRLEEEALLKKQRESSTVSEDSSN